MPNQPVIVRPRRRSGAVPVLLLIMLLLAGLLLLGFGFFSPVRLALVQERALGLLHGGIAGSEERTYIDACVQAGGAAGPQAVTRTVRTITFRDGASLSVIFNSSPTPTNSQCSS